METRTKIIVAAVALVVSYGFGRWSAPEKVKTVTETVEVEKKQVDTKSDLDLNKHKETTTTMIKKPDGTTETTTKVTEDTSANRTRDSQSTDQTDKSVTETKEVTYSASKVTVSALGGLSLGGIPRPIYGGSVQKNVLGPISVGAWGLNNETFGVSIGLSL